LQIRVIIDDLCKILLAIFDDNSINTCCQNFLILPENFFDQENLFQKSTKNMARLLSNDKKEKPEPNEYTENFNLLKKKITLGLNRKKNRLNMHA
jgi:hypothetical protein